MKKPLKNIIDPTFYHKNIFKNCLSCLIIFLIFNFHYIFASPSNSSSSSLDIAIKGYGLSIGNSKKINGIRINLVDSNVERINGLNITLWKPKRNPDAVINGASIGLVSTAAKEINGIAIGTGVAGKKLNGVFWGLVGLGSNELRGIAVGGLGTWGWSRW